ncbi:pre-rRNA-processing protein esf1, partial [Gonapodya sp. JEL0774]
MTFIQSKALQHSNVILTWDEDDPQRVKVTRRRFTKDDLIEQDLKAYIASSEEEDEEEDATTIRKKYAALLEDDEENGGDKDQEMEITFTPGMGKEVADLLEKKKEKEKAKDETVWEQQLRKQKEKRKRKRAERMAQESANVDAESEGDSEDSVALVGEDPFFAEALKTEFKGTKPRTSTKPSTTTSCEAKQRTKADKAADKRVADELALVIDTPSQGFDYDQRAILKQEKASKNKKKHKKRKQSETVVEDTFEIDVKDQRFAPALDSHMFAIDPTNP